MCDCVLEVGCTWGGFWVGSTRIKVTDSASPDAYVAYSHHSIVFSVFQRVEYQEKRF